MARYHCSNCREVLSEDKIKKVAIGTDRAVVFCAACNCYVTLEEKVAPKPSKPE